MLIFALPFAALDFGWGPMERWPHAGWPMWVALGCVLLADHMAGLVPEGMGRKILFRTGGFVLAGCMTLLLLRTDLLRSVGLPWSLSNAPQARHTWLRFFRLDPAGRMMGWRLGANALDDVLKRNPLGGRPWFVIARDWQVAAATEFYLAPDAPLLRPTPAYPRIHSLQGVARNSPHSLWPRYDSVVAGEEPFAGRDAIYLSDTAASTPPPEVRRQFTRTEVVAVLDVMHAGQRVRSLKIFACHGYRPPEF
jgi:hypothetical protein